MVAYICCMKFCIIDISNLVHRAKHATSTSSKNKATSHDPFADDEDVKDTRRGLIIAIVMGGLLSGYEQFGADHCVATFDRRSWRLDEYSDYKTKRRNRTRTPDEEEEDVMVKYIITEIKEYLTKYTDITVLEADGAEADDFIARWIQLHDDEVFEHVIVSSDSDFKQLVRNGVELFNPIVANRTLYTLDGVFIQDGKKARKIDSTVELYGQIWKRKLDTKTREPVTFDPKWELFMKCIRGDSTDDIPSAWPRVYETKIRAAYEGTVTEYNNFINSTWGKDGDLHSVREAYDRNVTLIDLTKQPQNVIDLMDEAIGTALERKPARLVGAYFSKFCSKHNLSQISARSGIFVDMFVKGYPS